LGGRTRGVGETQSIRDFFLPVADSSAGTFSRSMFSSDERSREPPPERPAPDPAKEEDGGDVEAADPDFAVL
jgi:hypothetical protein